MRTINLVERLSTFTEHWQPRTVGEFNGHDVMVAKLKGEFVWHKHDNTDDFFLVLKGRVTIQMRTQSVTLEESHILLIEPTGTPNTGDPKTAAPRWVISASPYTSVAPDICPAALSHTCERDARLRLSRPALQGPRPLHVGG